MADRDQALEINAILSDCWCTMDPGPAVVLMVDGVTPDGKPASVHILFPASGVQSLLRNLWVALTGIPLEHRQENN